MNRRFCEILLLVFLFSPLSSDLIAEEGSYSLFLSKNHGYSWSRSDTGMSRDTRINALASTKITIIAGTDAGIIISTNSGDSWHPAAIPSIGGVRVTSIAHLSNRIFAGTSEGFLLSSSDNGAVWKNNSSLPRRWIRSLHVRDQTLYIGTDADHVYASSNQGETWTHLSAGLPPQSQIFALTTVGEHLFAGLYAKGLYTWSEADQKWFRIGVSDNIQPLALATTGSTLVVGHNPGGIYWSDDFGRNWKRWSLANAPTPFLNAPNLFPSVDPVNNTSTASLTDAPIWEMVANEKFAITGAGGGIYYSTDRARTWTSATNGFPATSTGIAFCVRPDLILAAVLEKSNSCAEAKRNVNE